MLYFPCNSCHNEVSAPEDEVGQFMFCPHCYTRQRVPPPQTSEKIENAEVSEQIYELRKGEKVKEYKDNIPVYCSLCRTLMYAAAEKIGSHLTCPDCGTKNLVVPIQQ
jgi:DNA-directed RNA polymerase subunit M/transcription elongation factor TFIIS